MRGHHKYKPHKIMQRPVISFRIDPQIIDRLVGLSRHRGVSVQTLVEQILIRRLKDEGVLNEGYVAPLRARRGRPRVKDSQLAS